MENENVYRKMAELVQSINHKRDEVRADVVLKRTKGREKPPVEGERYIGTILDIAN